ncbi:hypothetical protein PC9H_000105 [Pleurotus ostreatus]|uniref:DUF7223 domain-containing protein n=1 Tax=Pleurotus ostreatus TaxID=5322 RepID=A0A8H7A3I9_PLEOS|nr:uncharacterized protein PC9H_000105 [Pleurotus ostreatus]KAF7439769.1 hypothetical protein PC9H_000105 [Pleurotus ostreatus]
MIALSLLSIPFLASLALALNDWSKPCFSGRCSYDLHGSVDGSMTIEGSPDAISDITPAAGWWIIGCDPQAEAQDIRIVCIHTDRCGHLFRNLGAQGKLVRLPEKCGKMAFARVVKSWVDDNQNVPMEVESKMQRRGADNPVRGLTLDTNFAAIDPSVTGPVHITIVGATVPGATGNATITRRAPTVIRRTKIGPRGSNFIESAFDRFTSFDLDSIKDLPPVHVNQNFPIIKKSFSCDIPGENSPSIKGSLEASIDASIHAVVQVGVAAEGTIIPPRIDSFGLFAALDADISGTLNIVASAAGTFDSGTINIFEQGIPGLEFPGILTVGPMFRLEAKASTTVEGSVDAKVGLTYRVEDAQLFFPKTDRKRPTGGFAPNNTPLKLFADPSISAKGSIGVHIIPKIEFGISALKGLAKATVSLEVDADASVNLNLDASAHVGYDVISGRSPVLLPASAESPATHLGSDGPVNTLNEVSKRDPGASVHGCIKFDAGIDAGAAVNGKFFGLFGDGARLEIYKTRFDIYEKCWGASTSAKVPRALYHISLPHAPVMRRDTQGPCYPATLAKMFMIVDQIIPGPSITSKH